MEKLKFIVVDDNITFLNGIIIYLEDILHHEVIGYAFNGKDFIDMKETFSQADIILMDVHMPHLNGIEATKKFLNFYRDAKVIAITNYPDTVYLKQLIYTGFKGCVVKDRIFEDLPSAIETVQNLKLHYPDEIKL